MTPKDSGFNFSIILNDLYSDFLFSSGNPTIIKKCNLPYHGAELIAGDISYLDIYFDSELASFGSKISLVSGATTVFTPTIFQTNKNVLRIELPNRLNYSSQYQLCIPTQANGGPSFANYVPGLVENFILSFNTKP